MYDLAEYPPYLAPCFPSYLNEKILAGIDLVPGENEIIKYSRTVQFTLSFLTLCDPMDCSMLGIPVHHQLLEFYSNSCPLHWWCHPTISSSVVPFSSCFRSCPASGSFQISHFFTSGGQSIGVSASASVLPNWFPLGWTGWIFLLSKGLSRVFSNTTVQKHQFFPHSNHIRYFSPTW